MIASITTLRKALKVELEEDDPELVRLEGVAVGLLEEDTGYSITNGTRHRHLSDWCGSTIPTLPMVSITSVKYVDINGTEQTLSAANWYIDKSGGPLWHIRFYGALPYARPGTIDVEYVSGWTSGTIPEWVIQGIVALVAPIFENPSAGNVVTLNANPAYQSILENFKTKGTLR